jgi:signal-transduction protein with cAMP-binding, CBS, and nucleotidyltransferase domain
VGPEKSIEECSNVMAQDHVGSLVILDGEKLKGIITEQDIVRKVIAKGLDPKKTKVSSIMVSKLMIMAPDEDIYDAIVMMRDNNIRHLPIVHKGRLEGYLTIKDVLKIQPQLFEIIVERFELREAENKPIIPENGEEICDGCGISTARVFPVEGLMYCAMCKRNKGL